MLVHSNSLMKDQKAMMFTLNVVLVPELTAVNYVAKPCIFIFLHVLMFTDLVRVDVHSSDLASA